MSENCSENSSGLLLVLGAPTTGESKGTRSQQSTFHHPQSPAAFHSRLAPPLHAWHYLDFPRNEKSPVGKYTQGYSWAKRMGILTSRWPSRCSLPSGKSWNYSSRSPISGKVEFVALAIQTENSCFSHQQLKACGCVCGVTLWANIFSLAILSGSVIPNQSQRMHY